MGFFDFIKGAFNSVKDGFASVGNAIKGAATSVWTTGKSVVSTVYNDVKGIGTAVITAPWNLANKALDTVSSVGTKLIDKTGDTLSNLGSSLALPIAVVGGVIALVMLSK